MPFLNWRQKQLGQGLAETAGAPARFSLSLDAASRDELAQALAELFAEGEGELRVDLPRSWIIFWKSRAGDSRLLLSHPSKDEYVATAALTVEHGQAFAARLRALQAGESVAVSETSASPLAAFSNAEIAIELSGGRAPS